MSDDKKWVGWDKPETVVSELGMELHVPEAYVKKWKPGGFNFKDGTTQGWKLDQLYDAEDENMTNIVPYSDPSTGAFYGFSLGNSQSLALAVSACPFMLPGSTASTLDFYLESPDLGQKPEWQGINGYSVDVQRNFLSLCGDPPAYKVQLQVRVWDKQQKKMRTFAEWESKSEKFILHPVQGCKPYHFVWTPDVFTNLNFDIRFLRIRCQFPNVTGFGAGECLPKGAWLVGNVTPE